MKEKDYSLGGKDRAEWERAWASMPHRRPLTPSMIHVPAACGAGCGELASATISEDPPQFSAKMWRQSDLCPVCGMTTVGSQRLPGTLHPTFSNGYDFLLGVWVHRACFESCPLVDEPAPIPW